MAFLRRFCVCSHLLKTNNFCETKAFNNFNIKNRTFKVSTNLCESEGWLSKLLMVRKIDTGKESHSRLLSDTEIVYEMQIHDVKPDSNESYINNYEKWTNELQAKESKASLIGSWKVEVGDQDQYIHVWKYQGWKHASQVERTIKNDSQLKNIITDQTPHLRSRQNQFMLPFSFWGHPEPQIHNSMYEMRSYVLKPGTMIEWGNNWARGITFRKDAAVAGFFSQIGQLYTVHHIWRYEDLYSRKETRESAWRKPGWDECVAYTVPLIREMRSRWMSPNSFSPIR